MPRAATFFFAFPFTAPTTATISYVLPLFTMWLGVEVIVFGQIENGNSIHCHALCAWFIFNGAATTTTTGGAKQQLLSPYLWICENWIRRQYDSIVNCGKQSIASVTYSLLLLLHFPLVLITIALANLQYELRRYCADSRQWRTQMTAAKNSHFIWLLQITWSALRRRALRCVFCMLSSCLFFLFFGFLLLVLLV